MGRPGRQGHRPCLYAAIGLSTAARHRAVIKQAGTIVAMDKDSQAQVFEAVDFGLTGDLFKFIPGLEQALSLQFRSFHENTTRANHDQAAAYFLQCVRRHRAECMSAGIGAIYFHHAGSSHDFSGLSECRDHQSVVQYRACHHDRV